MPETTVYYRPDPEEPVQPPTITQEQDVECFILSMPRDMVQLMVEIVKRIDD